MRKPVLTMSIFFAAALHSAAGPEFEIRCLDGKSQVGAAISISANGAATIDDKPPIASGASNAAQGEAETRLSYAALKYARHARGGRVQPLSLSNILDMTPPVKDPKVVLTGLEQSASPATYLTGLNPKHPEFEKLRQALLKARGPHQPEEKIDDALKVKIPAEGKTLKRGVEHEDVVLLRKRLKLELSENANNRYFDDQLEAALKAFQVDKGIKANGQLTEKTRSALNREAEPQKADPKRELDRLIVNMERWRWLPEDLGSFYVMNNIPEFVSRIMKNGNEALKQKIVAVLHDPADEFRDIVHDVKAAEVLG